MRTFAPGRHLMAAAALAVLAYPPVGLWGPSPALAAEDLRACLMREAGDLFGRLAAGIGTSEVDPASIDDAFIDREAEPIVDKCAKATNQSEPTAIAAFRTHLARWSYHLDRKLSEINAKGTPD